MVRIASYNVENLFARPKAFDRLDWEIGKPILKAYKEVNKLFNNDSYSSADKTKMRKLLLELDIYTRNSENAIRRKYSSSPKWAWLRKNRGTFDRQPSDRTKSIVIEAKKRKDWIGWVELAKEPTDEKSVRMTAKVVNDLDADIIAIVEAEDRPSLVRFNRDMLDNLYRHVMLVDGNDERGIDVGIMTKAQHTIESIISNVDTEDSKGEVFSRDCPQYEILTPNGNTVHVLINHFKSQSGGGGEKRNRQAKQVRKIANTLVGENKHVVVLGDLNEGPKRGNTKAENLKPLYNRNSPLVDCFSLPNFDVGARPGTYNSCGLSNRLDYIFISKSLLPHFKGGKVFRSGLWGKRKSRPDAWEVYPEIENGQEQASDHAALCIDLDI